MVRAIYLALALALVCGQSETSAVNVDCSDPEARGRASGGIDITGIRNIVGIPRQLPAVRHRDACSTSTPMLASLAMRRLGFVRAWCSRNER